MKEYVPTYPNPDDDHRPEWEKKLRPLFSAAEDKDGEGARPSSLIPVHRPKVIDPLHELNLLRMMQVANERTVRELGPLPPGGLPVQKKRKPTAPYTDFLGRVVPEEQAIIEENDEMKLRQLAATAILTAAGALAACDINLDATAAMPSSKSQGAVTNSASASSSAQYESAASQAPISNASAQGSDRQSEQQIPSQTATKKNKLTFRELSIAAGVDCKDPDRGLACSTGNYEAGDYSDVQLVPDCGPTSLFAGVTNKKGAELLDRAPPKDTASLATLSEGQLVCIRAIAHIKGTPTWYYVTVVPAGSLEHCARTQPCAKYGEREVRWHVEREDTVCRSGGPREFSGGCAAGWVNPEDLEIFQMDYGALR